MASSSTLSEQLHVVFSNFNGNCSGQVGSVWEVWHRVFPVGAPELLRILSHLAVELDRLEEQVRNSNMNSAAIDVFVNAMAGYKIILNPGHMHAGWQNFAPQIQGNQLGILTMTTFALSQKFPEPIVKATDVHSVTEQLKALAKEL